MAGTVCFPDSGVVQLDFETQLTILFNNFWRRLESRAGRHQQSDAPDGLKRHLVRGPQLHPRRKQMAPRPRHTQTGRKCPNKRKIKEAERNSQMDRIVKWSP
ncbi:Hypothetical predicted protein [Pelobates cultripes]|uniref:Uncharacterized protein n=1 Tax=Pelobates cultripes TaxID=61616 RepID=A0AAD1R9J7_PELCU|nr:Hypothetical predicted protein [Pelobates cultripes]